MKNFFTKKIYYGLSMMLLAMMMTFGLHNNAKGQSIDIVSVPVEQQFVGGTATFSYNAADFPVSATETVTFFLFYVDDGDPVVLEEDKVLATSTVQGATTTLDIVWPVFETQDKAIDLIFAAYSGDVFTSDNDFDIDEEDLIITSGADGGSSYDITFYKAGERRATTDAFDVDYDENVRLHVNLTDNGSVDEARPLVVQYSTNGIDGPFTTLIVDDAMVDTNTPTTELYDFDGTESFYFDLPEGAKTTATTFQVLQVNSTTISTNDETWSLNDMDVAVGDIYSLIDPPGVVAMSGTTDITVSIPVLDVTDVMSGTESISGEYAGNDINVAVSLPEVDLSGYGFAAVLEKNDYSYILSSQSVDVNQDSETLIISGTIPANAMYWDDYTVAVYAFDKDDDAPVFGLDYDISSLDPGDFEVEGGTIGTGITFDEAGDRSVTFPALAFPAIDESSYIEYMIKKNADQLSPSGTDIVFEYSVDGGAFVEYGTVAINELSTGGMYISWEGDEIPSAMASDNTVLRVRQEGNNGADLDGWTLMDGSAQSGTNIASSTAVKLGTTGLLDVWRPDVTVDPVPITFDNRPFPMVDYTLTYTIEDGAFPEGTGAMVMLERQDDPSVSDIILGSTDDITGGEIDFKVPPIVADDYTLYLLADHIESDDADSQYGDVSLPIENISIEIEDHSFSNSVTIGSTPFGLPGTAITVNYTVSDMPGDDAELMLKVYDYHEDVDDYVLIGASTSFDGSITATLPTDIIYQDDSNDPKLALSLGNGVFTRYFGDLFVDDRVFQSGEPDSDIIESIEGNSNWGGYNQSLTSEGVRSITSQPFDVSQGGQVRWRYYTAAYDDDQPFRVEASVDGETWTLIDEYEFSNCNWCTHNTNDFIPSEVQSETTQFRLIYNDEFDASDLEDNVIVPLRLRVRRPIFLETQDDDYDFDLAYPEINVGSVDAEYTIGESITVNYNAFFFPDDTEFALVLEQGSEYTVLGRSTAQDASSISGTLPFAPLDPTVGDTKDYTINVIPFVPDAPGGDYIQDQTLTMDKDDDFISIEGSEAYIDTNNKVTFEFREAGNRSLLTGAFDLTMAESVRLKFDYNKTNDYSSFSLDDNKNVVPRLEVSIDAGASFQTIPVYELDEDEEQMYDDGLLYMSGNYEVYIPEEYKTSATHFRWSQPLNQGDEEDIWEVRNFKLKIGSGNEFDDNLYSGSNQDQDIDVLVPNIDHYEWMQSDPDDAVFNGDSFGFTFAAQEDVEEPDMWPPGTMFMFTLAGEIDPDTNEDIVIGSITDPGEGTGSIPFYIVNDNYDVNVKAYIMVDDEPFVMYEDEWIGDLDVFLKAVKLSHVGEDDLATLYAGSSVEFSIDIENVESASDSFDDLYANLIVDYLGEDWLLAAQQGIDNITIDLPPFMRNGIGFDPVFSIRLTEDGPIGAVGTILDSDSQLSDLEDMASNFIAGTVSPGNWVSLAGTARRVATTRDIEASELEDASLLSFEIYFDQLPEDLTNDQYVVFEVSTDGGATYTPWQTFPDMDAEETLNYDYFVYEVTDEMKAGTTRLRWRQEESKGSVYLRNISFSFGEALPFEYAGTSINDIQNQAVIITSIDSEEACLSDEISINYEIRGVHGAETELIVQYSGPANGTIYDVDMGVGQGSGTAVFTLPSDVLAQGAAPGDFRFNLYVDDTTFDELLSDVTNSNYNESWDGSSVSEQAVNVVGPINLDQSFAIQNNQILCDPEDIIVKINGELDNYTYEIFNVADGTVLGSLTYDAEEGDDEINIGMMSGTVELGMNIMSATASGAVCNTATSSYTDVMESVSTFELYRSLNSGTSVATSGESFTICEANSTVLLSLRRQTNTNAGTTSQLTSSGAIEWFRDDFATPVSADGNGYEKSTFDKSGDYFARVTYEGCEYITESVAVEVLESIKDIPEITVTSGDLIACSGDIMVGLSAPEGFEYYSWSNGAKTRSMTVTTAGSYTVQVSNVPFDLACESSPSLPVVVESAGGVDFQAALGNGTGNLGDVAEVTEGDMLEACDSQWIYFFEDGVYRNDGTVIITKDGAEYASTNLQYFELTESGTYSLEWISDDLTNSCSDMIGDFTVAIADTPEGVPSITTAGDLTTCESDLSVTITAPSGFSHYKWYFYSAGGSSWTSDVNSSETFLATMIGEYKVAVGNSDVCFGDDSRVIELTAVATDDDPTVEVMDNTDCGASATTVEVQGSLAGNSYQLFNYDTDAAEGDAVAGNGGSIYLTSASHDQAAQFYVVATTTDGAACAGDPSSVVWGYVSNVLLEASGNIITAVIEDADGPCSSGCDYDITWFRNGVEMINVSGDNGSITVIDDATYSVSVVFDDAVEGACTVTSNAVSLGGGAGGNVVVPQFETSVYPNPTRDQFTLKVEGEDFGLYTVQIMSLSGKVVFRDSFDKQTEEFTVPLSIGHLKAGIYNLNIVNDIKTTNLRISKF
ncbi:MAG: T9SS type A sorting domain-containing protein [Cyclobacteriaceae bacterium]